MHGDGTAVYATFLYPDAFLRCSAILGSDDDFLSVPLALPLDTSLSVMLLMMLLTRRPCSS